MRILTLLNDTHSPPGLIQERLRAQDIEPVTCLASRGIGLSPGAPDQVPENDRDYDALIVLGGAMCADQDRDGPAAAQEHAYLPAQADLIRRFGDAHKPVLGICLGGQLISRAYGGELVRQGAPEFGFTRVDYREAAREDPLLGEAARSRSFEHLMEWHSDMFTLPPEADLLMGNEVCPQQAIRIRDRNVWGFQFHPEVNADILRNWIRMRARLTGEDPDDLGRIIDEHKALHLDGATRFMHQVLDRFLQLAKGTL